MPIFEIRLVDNKEGSMVFVTIQANPENARVYASRLLSETLDFERAEVWEGMNKHGPDVFR